MGSGEQDEPWEWGEGSGLLVAGVLGLDCGWVQVWVCSPTAPCRTCTQPHRNASPSCCPAGSLAVTLQCHPHPRILYLCHRLVEHPHRGAFQVERKRLMRADFINQGCHWDDCCLPEPLYEQ